ncbi:hypothetical protein HDU97_010241 [Phlyctochytrium planicorne]|nr:hypothetical protein HDU97_010241 [Phlyctochytrium planicorne]
MAPAFPTTHATPTTPSTPTAAKRSLKNSAVAPLPTPYKPTSVQLQQPPHPSKQTSPSILPSKPSYKILSTLPQSKQLPTATTTTTAVTTTTTQQQPNPYAPIPRSPAQAPKKTTASSSSASIATLKPSSSAAHLIITRVPSAQEQLQQLQNAAQQPFLRNLSSNAISTAIAPAARPAPPTAEVVRPFPSQTNLAIGGATQQTVSPPRYVVVLPHPSQQPQQEQQQVQEWNRDAMAPRVKFFISGSGTPSDDGMQQATMTAMSRANVKMEDEEDGSDFYSSDEEDEVDDDDEDYSDSELDEDACIYSDEEGGSDAFADGAASRQAHARKRDPMFEKVELPTSGASVISTASFSSTSTVSSLSERLSPSLNPSSHHHNQQGGEVFAPPNRTNSTRSLLSAALEGSGLKKGHPSLIKNLSTMGSAIASASSLSSGNSSGNENVYHHPTQFISSVDRAEMEGEVELSESLRQNLMKILKVEEHQKGPRHKRLGRLHVAEIRAYQLDGRIHA